MYIFFQLYLFTRNSSISTIYEIIVFALKINSCLEETFTNKLRLKRNFCVSIICFLDLIIIKIYHLINELIGCIKGDSNDFLWPLFQFFISYWQWQRFHEKCYNIDFLFIKLQNKIVYWYTIFTIYLILLFRKTSFGLP